MERIDYSTNWNWKLCNKSFFTTIRKSSPKYRIGQKYLHVCKDLEVIGILEKIEIRRWSDFNEYELALDTGYDRAGSEKIFKSFHKGIDFETQDFAYMLFKKFSDRIEQKDNGLFG